MGLSGPNNVVGENYLRAASPNERRCIVRESLGYYHALVVGGIYDFERPVNITSVTTYAYALRQCVDCHPGLSVAVEKVETESPHHVFCPRIELSQHVQFLEPGDESNMKTMETFLNALQENLLEHDLVCTPPRRRASLAFDTADNLPISWSFLLAPALGAYLPSYIARLFGFRAAASEITPGTWTASPAFHVPGALRTGVEVLSIDSKTVDDALKLCRTHGAKMTGLIHQLIINALSKALPQSANVDNLAAQTAIDMRNAVGVSKDEMGLFVSGDYQTFPLPHHHSQKDAEFSWDLAKSVTERLAVSASKLHDQPVGLLRYLPSMRTWTLSKIHHRRDCSYELSNLVSFHPSGPMERCSVSEMVFCQPAHVTGAPLVFNVVSVSNGPMNICVNWQIGALELGGEKEEIDFVHIVCQIISHSFTRLSQKGCS